MKNRNENHYNKINKTELKYPMSEGNTCVARQNLEALPITKCSKELETLSE